MRITPAAGIQETTGIEKDTVLIYFLHYCSWVFPSCYFTGLNVHVDHLLMEDHVASSEDTKWLNFKTITGLLQGYIIKISVVNSNYSHAVSAGFAVWMLDVEIPTPCCISGCKSWIKLINGVSGQACSTGTSSTGFWGVPVLRFCTRILFQLAEVINRK